MTDEGCSSILTIAMRGRGGGVGELQPAVGLKSRAVSHGKDLDEVGRVIEWCCGRIAENAEGLTEK